LKNTGCILQQVFLQCSQMNFGETSVRVREASGGQIFTGIKKDLKTTDDLSIFYTPGIAEPCRRIAADKSLAKKLTIKKNMVAVISDGSAVLGLGNIGPEAALPVMEGKSMLFKQFGGVDAVPIVLDTQDIDEIIETVVRIAPTFGGINLEDIAAPRCFEIERQLVERLDIPVFHDDQHGTAMVVLAALQNALRIVKKPKEDIRVTFSGAGAAGIAIAKLLQEWGVVNITMVDSRGIIACERPQLHGEKKCFCVHQEGDLSVAMKEADVFIGVSKKDLLTPDMIRSMASDPIIFAMANPDPEILPHLAHESGAAIVATGRSDFPNQINNVLIFPGFFRGLLDGGITKITTQMMLKASTALAKLVPDPTADRIIPSALDPGVADAIAQAVKS